MPAIVLTKAAYEVLKADAEREMENSFGERHLFRGEAEGYEHERLILACADVLGSLGRWAPKHGGEYEFTDEALAWMKKDLGEIEDHLDHLDTSEEGPLDYTAKQAPPNA